MKFLHVADLHIGKKVNEFSMAEDQRHILRQIIEMVRVHRPDGLLIAGDVYDKNIPGVDGVMMLDQFLTELYRDGCPVYMVSGNHDSGERLAFGRELMRRNQIYISGGVSGCLERIRLEDAFGPLNLYLMPFIRPSQARHLDPEIATYHQAVKAVLDHEKIDPSQRNVLVAHQFVVNGGEVPERSDSEQLSLGTLDQVDASLFDGFDYVALGHLHGPQKVGRETVRYAGSPLKYSFSECRHRKSAVLVAMEEKGQTEIQLLPFTPLHDMREIRGPIGELLREENYSRADVTDYIRATLTDEGEIYDAMGRLRTVYPNLMKLDFDNSRTLFTEGIRTAAEEVAVKTPQELFREFYESQNHVSMSAEQEGLLEEILREMEGDGL